MNVCDATGSSRLSRLANEVLAEILRDASAHGVPRERVEPSALLRRVDLDCAESTSTDAALLAAERELEHVHRSELAYLLRSAAALRGTNCRFAPTRAALSIEAWRACLIEELDCIEL